MRRESAVRGCGRCKVLVVSFNQKYKLDLGEEAFEFVMILSEFAAVKNIRGKVKTLELLECLSGEEHSALGNLIQHHRRPALFQLYQFLSQEKEGKPSSEALFAAAFNKPYRKESDYLLRNELRLLNREIEGFLVERAVLERLHREDSREIIPGIVWLELLLERKQQALFEKEWRSQEKTAREQSNHALLMRLSEVYLTYIYRYQELHPDLYQKASALLARAREAALLSAEEQIRRIDVKRAYVHRLLGAFDGEFAGSFEETALQPAAAASEQLLFRYLRAWAQTYLSREKIPIFLQLLEWQPEIVRIRPEFQENTFVFLNNLALLYMHEQKDYVQADLYFSQAMNEYRRRHKTIHTELFFNYLSNLTRLERFEEVIWAYASYRVAAEADQKLRFKFKYLLAMNHLLLKQPRQALAYIPEDLRQRPRFEYVYTRFMYAIAYYQDGLEELFEREVQNLYQSIRYKMPEEAQEWGYTLEVFRKFARIVLTEPHPKVQKERLQSLRRALESDWQHQITVADNLILFWLTRELAILSKKIISP